MNTLSKRIERVVTMLYSEVQQSKAARQLKIGQPLLSRTLSGDRAPSKTLVTALATMPDVNARWLLNGIGEPLFYGDTSLPVVSRLPRSATTPWEEVASNTETFRIAENQFSDSRYWWRLTAATLRSWGTMGQKATRVAVGDYLLLETDPQQMAALTGQPRLAISAHPAIEGGKPCWGRLSNGRQFTSFKEEEKQRPENEQREKTKAPKRKLPRRNLSDIGVERESPQKKKMSTKEENKIQIPQMSSPKKDEQTTQLTIENENLRALVIEMTSTSPFRFESNGS